MATLPPEYGTIFPNCPPQYQSGPEVKPAPKSTVTAYASEVSICVDKTQFTVGDVVTGNVTVTPFSDIELSNLKIEFQSVETIRRARMFLPESVIRTVTLSRFSIPSFDSDGQSKILKKGLEYTFTFSLHVPHSMPKAHCENSLPLHYQLPPMFGSQQEDADEALDTPLKTVTIGYRVRARLIKPSGTKEFYRYVRVLPTYPPVELEPSSPYTSLSVLGCPGLLKMKKPIGNVQTTLMSPRVPILYLSENNTVNLSLELEFSPCGSKNLPPAITSASFRVISHMLSSSKPLDFYPLYRTDNNDKKMQHVTRETESTGMVPTSFSRPTWRPGTRTSAVTSISMPIYLPPATNKDKTVPTFFSCHASRQYEVELMLEFANGYTAKLTVPLILAQDHRGDQFENYDFDHLSESQIAAVKGIATVRT
uniref:ARAD1D25586p n=1 Tax=Blastobotrys adeninivorans TaxID=409370 RepID=A0A060TGS8_BLAAD